MEENISELFKQTPAGKAGDAATYMFRMRDALSKDQITDADHAVALTIVNALLNGFTLVQWEQEQRGTVQALKNQSPDEGQNMLLQIIVICNSLLSLKMLDCGPGRKVLHWRRYNDRKGKSEEGRAQW